MGVVRRQSRAVERPIEPGNSAYCNSCGRQIKFIPPGARKPGRKVEMKQIICNVYRRGIWQSVECFHPSCYKAANSPHGSPQHCQTPQQQRRAQVAREVEERDRVMVLAGLSTEY